MKEFQVDITEILQITVNVRADSEEKALEAVRKRYGGGAYELNRCDLVAAEFDIRP